MCKMNCFECEFEDCINSSPPTKEETAALKYVLGSDKKLKREFNHFGSGMSQKKYYQKNAERKKAYQREYYYKNREEILKKKKIKAERGL